ncbi:MAG: hypothetical protein ACTSRG_08235 [Candidatus Helarchaeota archaeon]
MATIFYDLEFLGNTIAGYSVLKNPWELIGLGIILVAMIIVAFLAQQMFKNYKETKMIATLYWALAFFFLLVAVVFLIIEKVSYSTLGNADLGDLMAILALITSGAAIVFFDIFSFHTTYPERVKVLTSFVSILATIYVGSLVYAIISGYPLADVKAYELVYNPFIDIIVYCTLLPIILIAPIIFFYYASRMREESPPNSKRSNWIGTGLLFFAIGYIAEVAPFLPTEFSIPFRIFFVLAGYTLWVCFSMPDWFKNRIGWTE